MTITGDDLRASHVERGGIHGDGKDWFFDQRRCIEFPQGRLDMFLLHLPGRLGISGQQGLVGQQVDAARPAFG